jgi:hypothetical protein
VFRLCFAQRTGQYHFNALLSHDSSSSPSSSSPSPSSPSPIDPEWRLLHSFRDHVARLNSDVLTVANDNGHATNANGINMLDSVTNAHAFSLAFRVKSDAHTKPIGRRGALLALELNMLPGASSVST